MKKVFLLSCLSVGLATGFLGSIHAIHKNWENTPLNASVLYIQSLTNKIPVDTVRTAARAGTLGIVAPTVVFPMVTTWAIGETTNTMSTLGVFNPGTSTSAKCALSAWELGVFAAWTYGLVNGTRWLSKKVRGKKSDDDQEPAGDGTESSEPVLENQENSAAVLEDVAQVDLVGEPE